MIGLHRDSVGSLIRSLDVVYGDSDQTIYLYRTVKSDAGFQNLDHELEMASCCDPFQPVSRCLR